MKKLLLLSAIAVSAATAAHAGVGFNVAIRLPHADVIIGQPAVACDTGYATTPVYGASVYSQPPVYGTPVYQYAGVSARRSKRADLRTSTGMRPYNCGATPSSGRSSGLLSPSRRLSP